MRNSLLSLAVLGTLLLAVPASAPAQDPASVQGAAAAPAQQPADQPGATVDPDPAQADPAQTDTTDTTDTTPEEDTAPGDPGDSDVPQQYTDPLAGQNDDTPNQQDPAETAPATQSVSAASGSQLPSTGAPAGLLALGGLALLGAGVAVRLLSRDAAYPYPYRRY